MLSMAAAGTNAIERLREVSLEFWLKMAAGLVGLAIAVVILRKVAKMNKLLLAGIVILVLSIIGFNWVYERNEPAWATPFVGALAEFLPSKGRAGR